MDRETLANRAGIIRGIRRFFENRDYLEVDTPLLAPDLIPESCLEVFQTLYQKPGGDAQPYWLIPSPELWMKKLLAQDSANIFQICHCFRNGESTGRIHSPEFTMLEYYTVQAGYMDSLLLTEELFRELGASGDLAPPFLRISLEEAFAQWAGFDLFHAASTPGALAEEARRLGLDPPADMGIADCYNLIFVHAIEPQLPRNAPVALLDYPAFVPCLARKAPGGKTVERWELYARGVELANCFSEETDSQEIRDFFSSEEQIKAAQALIPHRVDREYWRIFLPSASGRAFPECSGVAMGLDRLIMVLLGYASLQGVLPFPMNE